MNFQEPRNLRSTNRSNSILKFGLLNTALSYFTVLGCELSSSCVSLCLVYIPKSPCLQHTVKAPQEGIVPSLRTEYVKNLSLENKAIFVNVTFHSHPQYVFIQIKFKIIKTEAYFRGVVKTSQHVSL